MIFEPNDPNLMPSEQPSSDAAFPVAADWSPLPPKPERTVEDLTLAQALGQLLRRPSRTARALAEVVNTPPQAPYSSALLPAEMPASRPVEIASPSWWRLVFDDPTAIRTLIQLGIALIALVLAFRGAGVWAEQGRRTEETFYTGLSFVLLGMVIWFAAEIYGMIAERRGRNHQQAAQEVLEPQFPMPAEQKSPEGGRNLQALMPFITSTRFAAGFFATLGSLLAMLLNANNTFTLPGVLAWGISIMLWIIALAPNIPDLAQIRAVAYSLQPRWGLVLAAALAFVLLGAYFRLNQLDTIPPEMTSDHYEKLLNAQDVLDGRFRVFFTNNGGREPFQMYAMALMTSLPGVSIDHTSLKLLSVLEGTLTLPVLFWLGREVIGRDQRRLGTIVGLILMGLVAASYWHVTLSRLGLRIVLTPLMTALVFIFVSRGIRDGNRWSFINAGLALGAGLYMYQAVRMVPVLVIAAFILAVIFQRKWWRQYVAHFAALVIVSFAVFAPMFMFSLQQPDQFWRRTTGRLFGDDFIETVDENGVVLDRRSPNLPERIEAFAENVPALVTNLRNALLMYNWQGDVQFINGAPNRPSMDVATGALLIVGVGAWAGLMIRRREATIWLVPLGVLIMILPSALAIAMPGENPSATRMSGSLPFVYLMAALPLALLVVMIIDLFKTRAANILVAGAVGVIVLAAYLANAETYFIAFNREYRLSVFAYTRMGDVLRGFAESDGGYGNAFMLGYPDGFGHREIGLEAGLPPGERNWPNGILWGSSEAPNAAANMPQYLLEASQRPDPLYRFDPTRDLLFYYAPQDELALPTLQALFPETTLRPLYYDVHPGGRGKFWIVRVPALGIDGFEAFLVRTGVQGGG